MTQYAKLIEYAMKLINNKEQAGIIVDASVKTTVDMYLGGKIKATEGLQCLYKDIRDKCYRYLQLRQSLS